MNNRSILKRRIEKITTKISFELRSNECVLREEKERERERERERWLFNKSVLCNFKKEV